MPNWVLIFAVSCFDSTKDAIPLGQLLDKDVAFRINALRCQLSHILSRAHQLLLLCLPYQCRPPMVTSWQFRVMTLAASQDGNWLAGLSHNPCCQP